MLGARLLLPLLALASLAFAEFSAPELSAIRDFCNSTQAPPQIFRVASCDLVSASGVCASPNYFACATTGTTETHLARTLLGHTELFLLRSLHTKQIIASLPVPGTLPPSMQSFTSLTVLDMDRVGLKGSLPSSLGQLTNLVTLNLPNNQLTGPIPREIGNLTQLQKLKLNMNQLTGQIPDEITSLSNLTDLYLGFNNFSGTIPVNIGNMTSLQQLSLGSAGSITGTVPPSLGSLTNLINLEVTNLLLNGALPIELNLLPSLNYVFMSNNSLTGPLPTFAASASKLIKIYLDSNNFTGPIPSAFGALNLVTELGINNNELSGAFPPELVGMTSLNIFLFFTNNISGTFPLAFSSSVWSWVKLYFADNPNLVGCFDPVGPPQDCMFWGSIGVCIPSAKAFECKFSSGYVCNSTQLQYCSPSPSSPSPSLPQPPSPTPVYAPSPSPIPSPLVAPSSLIYPPSSPDVCSGSSLSCNETSPGTITLNGAGSIEVVLINASIILTPDAAVIFTQGVVISSNLSLSQNSSVTSQSSIQLEGALVVTGASSITVNASSTSSGALLQVSNCIEGSGSLTINVTDIPLTQTSITVFNASCGLNSSNVVVNTQLTDSCRLSTEQRKANEIVVAFSLRSDCKSLKSIIPGMDPQGALAVVVAVPVVVVLFIVVLAVLLGIPSLRRKVFPYAGRERYTS